MYYIGLFFYIITFAACLFLQGIQEMVLQCIELAPEISYAMFGIYLYPLIIFLCHKIFNNKTTQNYTFLASQTKLSASVTVSLGLVGTFIGLTGMITAISASLSGDGDVSEKMNSMISSISLALDSMSFAFLTSILGVSISVLLLVSLNFFQFFYSKGKGNSRKEVQSTSPVELTQIQQTLDTLQTLNLGIAKKFISVSEDNDVAKEISLNLNELSRSSKESLAVLKSIKEIQKDWNIKFGERLLEEQNVRKLNNIKIEEELSEIKQSIQWIKSKILESKRALLKLLTVE